jgi:divalent metal cation (Fe/Co/Zn/Cd) transporter
MSFRVSFRAFLSEKKAEEGFWDTFRHSKDPTIFTILFEDIAALIGIGMAFAGVLVGIRTHNRYADGVATIAIGMLLAVVAVLVARETKGLLVGETAGREKVAGIRSLAQLDPAVERVGRPLTMQLGPDQILVNLEIKFRAGLSVKELEAAVDRIEKSIRSHHPDVRHIFIEAESFHSSREAEAAM